MAKNKRKYYDISGVVLDTNGNQIGTMTAPTVKQREQVQQQLARQKAGVKTVEQTQKTLKNANREFDLASKRYENALSNELQKTGLDYRTKFEDMSKKKISYQTKNEDKPKNQPTPIPIVEVSKKLKKELDDKDKAYTKWKIANYENDLAEIYDEKTTGWDKTGGNVTRALKDLVSPLTIGDDRILYDENGNKTFLPSRSELKQQKVSSEMSGVGKALADIGYNSTKILGAGAIDLATGGIGGKALYWTDMATDNYKNVINQGYSNMDAITHTIINTGSEFLTEKVMGAFAQPLTGAKKISGLQEVFANSINRAIKNPRVANILASMGSEGLEEFTQEFIGALNDKITLGQDTNIEDLIQDALYSGLIGMGSGGFVTAANGNIEGRIAEQNYNAMGNTLADLNMLKETNNSSRVNNAIEAAQNYRDNVFSADYEKAMDKVGKLNEVEREALTEITRKRLAGEILDQNDLDTINYLNNRDEMQTDLASKVQEGTQPQTLKPTDTSDKLLNFRNSVENEGIQDAEGFYKAAEKIIQDKDYNVIMDSSIKNEKGKPVNAVISNENGITIRINPKSERAAEILLMHEVTHGIETKEMSNLIMNYASKNAEFNDALESLKKAYGTEDITPEVIADISGQLLGRQDFIDSLSTENPSLFKIIYDKIVELKNKLTGNSNYDNFVKDLHVKWERAYRNANIQSSQQNLKEGAKYSKSAEITDTTDNDGNKLSKGQIDYFDDSKVRDDEGHLIKVYHTTTGPVIQFNEFNPVGTRGYKFGKNIVNYFAASKDMSGSYAKQRYEMADTKKLNSIEEAQQWLDEIGVGDLTIEGTSVYEGGAEPELSYNSEEELLRNLKSDIQRDYGNAVNTQFEGYLLIKNPYIVDAEGGGYASIAKAYDLSLSKAIDDAEKHKDELYKLAQESMRKFELDYGKSKMMSSAIEDVMDNIDNKTFHALFEMGELDDIFDYEDGYEMLQDEFSAEDLPVPKTKIRDVLNKKEVERIEKSGKYYEKDILDWDMNKLFSEYDKYISTLEDNPDEWAYFEKNYKKILGKEVKTHVMSAYDWYELSKGEFSEWAKEMAQEGEVETNDIVKFIIAENKTLLENGKYDGLIFKNIVDYGGPSLDGLDTPGDIYVTFNSNQFKAADNLTPTNDPDIRYSQKADKWERWIEKNFKNEGPKTVLKDHIKKSKKQIKKDMIDKGVKPKVAEILTETPRVEENKSSLREDWHKLKRKFVDKGEAVYRLAKKTKNRLLYAMYDKMGTSVGEANYHIGEAQTTLKGNAYRNFTDKEGNKVSMSLNQIWDGIDERIANEYLAHYLNMDRYKQKNLSGENRYVFGESVTDKDSAKRIKELEKAHPELKLFGENVWQYGRNQLKNMVDAGLISKEQAEQFVLDTPHYVRLQRNVPKGSKNKIEVDKNGNAVVNKQIKEFKGSDLDILPFKDTMAQYTMDVIQSMRANLFGQELAKTLGMSASNDDVSSVDEIFGFNPDLIKDNEDGTYSFTIFNKGQAITLPIDEGIYEALQPNKKYDIEDAAIFSGKFGIRNADKFRRSLLTDKNPLFLATNMLKDLFDAPLNSQRPTAFVANYIPAIKQIVTNGKYYQQYKSLGGLQNTYFDSKEGFKKQRNKLNPVGWFEKANNAVEQFPRLAEFMATMKATGNIDEAMYNAAEITTNFKRGGDITKAINRNGGTFLNASVQGFSRFVRNFTDIRNPQQAVKLLAKVVILGIGPALINDMWYDDDDDYKDLQDYIKDNYYLFKGKNGTWIRIPKGRAVSVFQDAARRTKYRLRGDKDAYSGMWSTFKNQIAPNNVFDSNIASPFVQVAKNKSWSGNPIVSDYTKNAKHPEEEYDVKTDELSKWLGKTFHLSPKKINYIIDQYSGVIGDFALPIGTKYAESKSDNALYQALVNPALNKFTTNSVTSSKAQQQFYQALQDAQDDRYWSKGTTKDTAVHKYLTSKNQEISKIRKEMTELQESNKPDSEKFEGALEYQKQINEIAKDAVKQSKKIKETHKQEYEIGGKYYTGEDAYSVKPETVEKAQNLGLSIGEWQEISTYQKKARADKRPDGSTIRGTAKQKVINYVYSKEELTEAQKRQILEQLYPKR